MLPEHIEAVAVLSPMQQGLLYHSLLDPQNGVYLNQHVISLRGPVDGDCLEQAWNDVVERHQIFRASFHWDKLDEPLMVVHRRAKMRIEREDWSALDLNAQAGRMEQWLIEDKQAPLSLDRPPLMRLRLVRVGEEDWRLCWTNHHLVLDGWSAAIVARELFEAYAARQRESTPKWSTVTSPFTAYLDWLDCQNRDAARAWWREHLSDFGPLAAIGSAPNSTEGVFQDSVRLTRDHTKFVAEAAKRFGVTLNTMVQAAWAFTLARWSRQSDVVFGVTSSGRPSDLVNAENMVGLFITTVPLRIPVRPDMTVAQFVSDVQRRALNARAHEHLPLTEIHEVCGRPSHDPFFDTLLVFENYPIDQLVLEGAGGLTLNGVEVIEATNYPLSLTVGPGLELAIQAAAQKSRFRQNQVNQLLRHIHHALVEMSSGGECRIGELALLTPDERTVVKRLSRGAAALNGHDDTPLHVWFERQANRTPDAPAICFHETTLTYRELNTAANTTASVLQDRGVGPESVVGVCCERSPEMSVALLAILKTGAAYLPLDPEYPAERLRFMARDSGAILIVSQGRFADRFGDFRTLLLEGEHENAYTFEPPTIPGAGAAYVIFTSGSTGLPKGAVNTHEAIVNRLLWMQEAFPIGPGDRVLQKTPFSFDVSVWELFWPLMTGATLVYAEPGAHRDAGRLARLIQEEGITTVHFVPPMLEAFLDEPESRKCSSLKRVICSGEALSGALQSRFFDSLPAELHNLYGPTEAAVDVSWYACDRAARREPVPIGKPIAGLELHILDEAMHPVAPGMAGELFIGGIGLARGYVNRPGLTADRFLPHPLAQRSGERLYRTGDLAVWNEQGDVEYLGRLDFQVKLHGLRIELGEIEAALLGHPAVRQAVVLVRQEDAAASHQLVAYLIADEPNPSTADVLNYVTSRLPAWMAPAEIVFLRELPLSPNGKVDRKSLGAIRGHSRSAVEGEPVGPRTEIERRIHECWSRLLPADEVGVSDKFFSVGGNSLLATRLISALRAEFEIELPLRTIFDAPTIAGLARIVEATARAADASKPVPAVARSGDHPLSSAQRRIWLLSQLPNIGSAYHMPMTLHLHGRLDRERLEASLRALVARHEALRTYFARVDGVPVQRVSQSANLRLEHTKDEQQPFDLSHAPLARASLTRLAPDHHRLSITMYHLIADGWTLAILARDLMRIWSGELLEPLPAQFLEYAHWEGSQSFDGSLEWWRTTLREAPRLELPLDHPRPSVPVNAPAGTTISEITPDVRDLALQRAAEHGATEFAVLLSAFACWLARVTRQGDIVLGTPTANRPRAAFENVAGCFVNTVALRVRVDSQDTFSNQIRHVSDVLIDSLERQSVPFDLVVDAMQVPRDPARTPLFDVVFSMQDAPDLGFELTGLRVVPVPVEAETAKFDLHVAVELRNSGLMIRWEYRKDLFDAVTVERWTDSFVASLRTLLDAPERQINSALAPTSQELSELKLLGAGESPSRSGPRVITRLFGQRAESKPEAPALRLMDGTAVSYAELHRWAGAVAADLQRRGVLPGDRVVLSAPRGASAIAGLLGILYTGAVVVPVEPDWPLQRRQWIAEDVQARVELTADQIDGVNGSEYSSPVFVEEEHPAFILFTSGSTGTPKGVVVPHRAIVRLTQGVSYSDLSHEASVLHGAPLAFDASQFEIWGALLNGGCCVVLPPGPPTPDAIAEAIRLGARTAWLTAGLFNVIVDEALWALEGLEQLLIGGEALSPRHVAAFRQRWPNVRLINGYGPTESATFATTWDIPAEIPGRSLSIGQPIASTQVWLVDEHLRAVPRGSIGEIAIAGDGLALGYWNRPQLTAASFVPDPFSERPGSRLYRTGDSGRWRNDDTLEFLGRGDAQVKLRGHRIELGEIEHAISRLPGVTQCRVEVQENASSGGSLVAWVAPESVDVEALRRALRDTLPEYLIPSAIAALSSLPLTGNGKLDRAALPVVVETRTQEPENAEEKTLAEIWSSVLGLDRVSVDDNFFAIGGDSLSCIRVVERAQRAGLQVTLDHMLRLQTVRAIATQSHRRDGANAKQSRPGMEVPLSPSQRFFFSLNHRDPHHYNLAQFLRTRHRLHLQDLQRIAQAIAETHDALRLRFHPSEKGWKSHLGDAKSAWTVAFEDLSALDADTRETRVRTGAERLQRSLHIGQGPMFALGYFDLGSEEPLLFAVAHHLAADGSSLYILEQDLHRAVAQVASQEPLRLDTPAATWSDWALALPAEAAAVGPASRWRTEELPWQMDMPDGGNLQGAEDGVSVVLDRSVTSALLQSRPLPHAVLAAVAVAIAKGSGRSATYVDWIGHGRETMAGLDVSGTVGYFATRTPIRLDWSDDASPAQVVDEVHNQVTGTLAQRPSFGVERWFGSSAPEIAKYPEPQWSFNFIGRLDRSKDELALLELDVRPVGETRAPSQQRARSVHVFADMHDGKLRVVFRYSRDQFRPETAHRWAGDTASWLNQLVLP